MRVRGCRAEDAGPADLEEMPSRSRSRSLAVDHQHFELRERLGTTADHHCHDLFSLRVRRFDAAPVMIFAFCSSPFTISHPIEPALRPGHFTTRSCVDRKEGA